MQSRAPQTKNLPNIADQDTLSNIVNIYLLPVFCIAFLGEAGAGFLASAGAGADFKFGSGTATLISTVYSIILKNDATVEEARNPHIKLFQA